MGRAFEFRKARKMKRWGKMAVTFTRIGKEIAMSVKQGGPDPANNPRLRVAMQNAKSESMPKDRIDAAIKRSLGKDTSSYEEIAYEAMCMKGVGLIIETATDNPTRTVANIRMHLNRGGGELGKSGSLDFAFERKSVFVIKTEGINPEELEFELIDAGLEEIEVEDGEMVVTTSFENFGSMQKALESRGLVLVSAELQRMPTSLINLSDEEKEQVENLIDKLEDDEDVQSVYSNIA